MLSKLAWGNVRRARRDYLVYLLTLSLGVMVFYAFNTISVQVDIAGIKTVGMRDLIGNLMSGVTFFLAFVMGFLLVYANNFIMRRRKKEFGLYQVLGMSRWQVARVMALETALVSGVALVIGLLAGLALSQLMVFFTAALFKTKVADFHFFISDKALVMTVACLLAIFLVTLVFNLRVVARAKIIDLMSAGRRGEAVRTRNPWVSAAVFVVGAVLVGVAYARLLHDGIPITGGEEMNAFYLTTALVVVGTILLFFGLSGFLLQVLVRIRGLYWRGLNPFTLRQLSSRVNTVSASLAVVSMVLFLAITSVTTGTSIMGAINSGLENGTPADYTASVLYYDQSQVGERNAGEGAGSGAAAGTAAESASDASGSSSQQGLSVTPANNGTLAAEDAGPYGVATAPVDLLAESAHREVSNPQGGTSPMTTDAGEPYNLADIAGDHAQVNVYSAVPRGGEKAMLTVGELFKMGGVEVDKILTDAAASTPLQLVRVSEYNQYLALRGKEPVDLGDDGYLITNDSAGGVHDAYDQVLERKTAVSLAGKTLKPAATRVDTAASTFINTPQGSSNTGTLIVPDAVLDALDPTLYQSNLLINYKKGVDTEQGDAYVVRDDQRYDVVDIKQDGKKVGFWFMGATRTEVYDGANTITAMVSYLAIYIGFVLVVACAAILTIQQLSGVSDAGGACRTLSEIGTSARQIDHSFLVQQAVFFIFPLAVGVAHSAVALRVVVKLVEMFGHVEISSMVGLACAIFAVCYGGYFWLTYGMSRRIIRDAIRAR